MPRVVFEGAAVCCAALWACCPGRMGEVAVIYSPLGVCWGIAGVSHGVSER